MLEFYRGNILTELSKSFAILPESDFFKLKYACNTEIVQTSEGVMKIFVIKFKRISSKI